MDTISNIIIVVLVFGGLIFFHELGHFSVARLFGMGIKTFSVGFGPVIFSRIKGKTKYQLAALPFGGYVALVGETPDAVIPEPFTDQESFSLRPAWQRFFVIFAGSFFNLLLAWILCTGLFFVNGEAVLEPVVSSVVEGSPAAIANLQPGDRIVQIDNDVIDSWQSLTTQVQFTQGRASTFLIKRGDAAPFPVTITAQEKSIETPSNRKIQMWTIGVVSKVKKIQEYSLIGASGRGFTEICNVISTTLQGLKGLVTRKLSADSVQGPVGIAQTIYEQAHGGFESIIRIMALLSIVLGTFNLFPIPVLDGGHLVFLLVEMVRGKPVPVGLQERAMTIGLFLLLSLMLFATYNDAMNFF